MRMNSAVAAIERCFSESKAGIADVIHNNQIVAPDSTYLKYCSTSTHCSISIHGPDIRARFTCETLRVLVNAILTKVVKTEEEKMNSHPD